MQKNVKIMPRILLNIIIIFFLIFSSCTEKISRLDFHSSRNAGESFLFADKDNVYMSWIESDSSKNYLYYSKLEKNIWSKKELIIEGNDWFINWADFPSISINQTTGIMIAHYLKKSHDLTFSYDVKYLIKNKKWSKEKFLHSDNTKSEHGFVSINPYKDGFIASWLDGRNTDYMKKEMNEMHSSGPMSLRSAIINSKGEIVKEYEIDDKVCDCCQTSITISNDIPIVAYRDRSDKEIRDVSISKLEKDIWTKPININDDGWKIYGCPVNGPSIKSVGNNIAVAWFTISNGLASINLKYSTNGGETFGELIKVNEEDSKPLGRIDLEMLDDGSVIVSWINVYDGKGKIALRKIKQDGKKGEIINPATISTKRISGFPQIEKFKKNLILSYTNEIESFKKIESLKIPLKMF